MNGEPGLLKNAPNDNVGELLRVGLVARDPLRILGLQTIVEASALEPGRHGVVRRAVLLPVSLPEVFSDSALSLLMIDASCTEHLFELLKTLRRMRPQVRLLVIGEAGELDYIQRVIGAGAKGYLMQTASENEIRMALEIVSDGSVWAPRKVLARLLDKTADGESNEAVTGIRFTGREIQVLRYLITGMGNREIAAELKIDESTVKAHLSRLMRKVGVTNRIELTLKALKQNLPIG